MTTTQGEPDGVARHCLVSGRVQGVFFRASACAEAHRLGVGGRVCNLADGRVEAWVYGAPPCVAAFCRWLGTGPPQARVDAVHCEPCAFEHHAEFRIA